DTFGDLVDGDEAVGEPERVRRTAEVGPLHERHARLLGAREHLAGVDAAELRPEEVAALGMRRADVRQLTVERREHRIAALSDQLAHTFEVRLEPSAADELVHRRLAE